MAASTALEGNKTTITIGSFSAQLLSVSGPSAERPDIDITHMGSPDNYREYTPGDLVEGGTVEITVHHLGSIAPPLTDASGTVVINWAGGGTGKKTSFSGYMKSYHPEAAIGEAMTASCSVKVAGKITWAAA